MGKNNLRKKILIVGIVSLLVWAMAVPTLGTSFVSTKNTDHVNTIEYNQINVDSERDHSDVLQTQTPEETRSSLTCFERMTGNTIYVGGTGPNNYTTIQAGINAANIGDTVFVFDESSPYHEHFTLGKTIILQGENKETTIIDGGGYTVVTISGNGAQITGFTIQHGGTGINIQVSYSAVSENIITSNSGTGISILTSCSYNSIVGNIITFNNYNGVLISGWNQIFLNNTISQNIISNNGDCGIRFSSGAYFGNIISENLIQNNGWIGVYLSGDYPTNENNHIFHNVFINNTDENAKNYGINIWDNGYPSGGNYWSDYQGNDQKHGRFQNIPGSDGIGDSWYWGIDGLYGNIDKYPLMYGGYPVVNINTLKTFATIQQAIDDPATMSTHTIFLRNALFTEHVVIDKSITLKGMDSKYSVLEGSGVSIGVQILADHVTLTDMTIQNAGNSDNDAGILISSDDNTINNVHINTSYVGIFLDSSTNNTISQNIIRNIQYGIMLENSPSNLLLENTIDDASTTGITLRTSPNNHIQHNTIQQGNTGIFFNVSNGNILFENIVWNNIEGCTLIDSTGNLIYHNDILNIENAFDTGVNTWDDGYPSGGNYWSDYTGQDANNDGIGDTPYIIPGNSNQDRYPLIHSWNHLPTTLYVDDDNTAGPWDGTIEHPYQHIMDAINASFDTDTVFVLPGTYQEHLVINKIIALQSEDPDHTFIDGGGSGNVITIFASGVFIQGFTIRHSGTTGNSAGIRMKANDTTVMGNIIRDNKNGIYHEGYTRNTIINNTIVDNKYGIYFIGGYENIISDNKILNNTRYGLYLGSQYNIIADNIFINDGLFINAYINTVENNVVNGKPLLYLYEVSNQEITVDAGQIILVSCGNITISDQSISSTTVGIELWVSGGCHITNTTISDVSIYGIYLMQSGGNTISGNTINHAKNTGLYFIVSSGNTITKNTFINNTVYGLYLSASSSNTIIHNNFITNGINAYDSGWYGNTWNDEYPSGGNYWSDFDEPSEGAYDGYHGINQDQPGADGIVDLGPPNGGLNPYYLPDEVSNDTYPFLHPDSWSRPPNEPNTPYPENGALRVPVDIDLSWMGGDPDNDPVTYSVYFGTTNPPPKIIDNQTATVYDPGMMTDNTTYYWQIISWDDTGQTTIGLVWSFTTVDMVYYVYVDDDFNESTPGWYHDHFNKIQDGINVTHVGGTVYVFNGMYDEHILIRYALTLSGENKISTIINGSGGGDVLAVTADDTNINGFTIQRSGNEYFDAGVDILSNDTTISDTIIQESNIGIYLNYRYNTINENLLRNNTYGIYLDSSWNTITDNSFINDGLFIGYSHANTIENNIVNGKPLVYLEDQSNIVLSESAGQIILSGCDDITIQNQELSHTTVGIELTDFTNNCHILDSNITDNTIYGIYLQDFSDSNTISKNTISNNGVSGIMLDFCDSNTIEKNTIANNNDGLSFRLADQNTIVENNILSNYNNGLYTDLSDYNNIQRNTISYNNRGIYFDGRNNVVFHNNFIGNIQQAYVDWGSNTWDNGYPGGGNYWSDHHDHDEYSGPGQTEPGSDGIVDKPEGGSDPYEIPYWYSETQKDWYPLMHEFVLGDMNVDGSVDFGDINPFVQALCDPALYQTTYQILPSLHGDINQDGELNFGDINPFVYLLTNT